MDGYNVIAGMAFSGSRLAEYKDFLRKKGLTDEEDADYTVMLADEASNVVACGSLSGSVIKQIAVDASAEGGGLCARVLSELQAEAARRGKAHLFLYTRPENKQIFVSLGFFPMAETEAVLMMENRRDGLRRFLDSIGRREGTSACIVCNCNPMTKGHQFLMETASAQCDNLYIFVLSEDGGNGDFPPAVRYELVKGGTAHLKNVIVCRSDDYIISRSTFPAYFLKDSADAENVRADFDLILFAARIAPALGITKRFVGTEPFDAVTRKYNARMHEILPRYGIEVKELPRKDGISAGRVRALLKERKFDEIREIVPENVYEYLSGNPAHDA